MNNETWFVTVIVVAVVAMLAGAHSGRTDSDAEFQKIIGRAGLSTECRQALERSAQEEF